MLESIEQLRTKFESVVAEVETPLADLEPDRLAANRAYTHGLRPGMTTEEVDAILSSLNYSPEQKKLMREVVAAAEPLDVEIAINELRQARASLAHAVEIVGQRMPAKKA